MIKTTSVFKKSEFWVSMVTCVSGLLMAFGVVSPSQASSIEKIAPTIIGALLSLFTTVNFVKAQHSAKVEVFKAMCAMKIEGATMSDMKTLACPEEQVSHFAQVAGL